MKNLNQVIALIWRFLAIIGVIAVLVLAIKYLRVDQVYGQGYRSVSVISTSTVNGYPVPLQNTPSSKNEVPYPAPKTAMPIEKNYLIMTQKAIVTPTLPPTAEDGWYIFTDSEAGYSFHYPKDSHLDFGKPVNHIYNLVTLTYHVPGQKGYHGLLLSVEPNKDKLSSIDFASSFVTKQFGQDAKLSPDAIAKSSNFQVGKYVAVKVTIPQTLTDFSLFLSCSDKIIMISPTRDQSIPDDPANDSAMKIFKQILATVQFN
jgi:hypothetical protein